MKSLLAFLLSCTAVAACPTADDLSGGILMEFAQTTVTFEQTSSTNIEMVLSYKGDDDRIYTYDLYRGVSALRSELRIGDDPEVLADTFYPFDTYAIEALYPFNPGDTYSDTVAETNRISGEKDPVTYTITFETAGAVTIGDCTYDALKTVETYQRGDDAFTAISHYLPDLGIGYLIGNRSNGVERELFEPISIK